MNVLHVLMLLAGMTGVAQPKPATPAPTPPQEPAVRLPNPPRPPAPPTPSPGKPTLLDAEKLYVIDADMDCLVLFSPEGLVKGTKEAGPLRVRGKFVDGDGSYETRTYKGKFIWTVEAVAKGSTELVIVPSGTAAEKDVIRRMLDVLGPRPPPPPPPSTVTIQPTSATVAAGKTVQFSASASDGSPIAWSTSGAGAVSSSGLFQAGNAPGTATVTAKSTTDPTQSATANVAVTGEPPSPAPIPADGFRFLIVYKTHDLASYPPAQEEILYAKAIRDYGDAKAPVGPNGKTHEWRIWDASVDASAESKLWQDALARPRKSTPWIVISNGKEGYEGPLPVSVDETLALLKKYGG